MIHVSTTLRELVCSSLLGSCLLSSIGQYPNPIIHSVFSVLGQMTREAQFHLRFRFLKSRLGGSDSVFGSWKDSCIGSSFCFWFGSFLGDPVGQFDDLQGSLLGLKNLCSQHVTYPSTETIMCIKLATGKYRCSCEELWPCDPIISVRRQNPGAFLGTTKETNPRFLAPSGPKF